MGDWKSCDNCSDKDCPRSFFIAALCGISPWMWKLIPCPSCGGALSITREHNGKRYRHCYSCHSEFYEDDKPV